MIKFFRKLRLDALSRKRFPKYLIYATGEIILVVIGILIALQINNWNETRKEQTYLNVVYAQIKSDLERDTREMDNIIKYLTSKNERLIAIVNQETPVTYYDSINASNYEQCEKCRSDVTDFEDHQNLTKGYELLKSITTDPSYKKDSLSIQIDDFYTRYNRFVVKAYERMSSVTVDNIKSYQKYDWYVPWTARIGRSFYREDFITYIFESEENRKKSAEYLIYSRWSLGNLESFNEEVSQLLHQLEVQLKE